MTTPSNKEFVIEDNSNKLTPKEIFFKYIVYLPLVIVCVGIAITTAYIYLRYKVPYYSSSISLLYKDASGKYIGGDENMMLDDVMLYKKRSNLANEIEILKSVNIMEDVVSSLGLNVVYYNEGKVKTRELYGSTLKAEVADVKDSSVAFTVTLKREDKKVFAMYDGKKSLVNTGDEISTSNGKMKIHFNVNGLDNSDKYYIYWLPIRSAAAGLAGAVSANLLNRDASIIRVNIATEIPEKGRDILNQLALEYKQMGIDDKNKVVDNTIQFIDERLSLISTQLGDVEGGKQNFQQRNNLVDLEGQSEQQINGLTEARKRLDEEEMRLQVIDMIRNYVDNPVKRFQLVPSSLGLSDRTLDGLIASYNELQLKRDAELKISPAAHPNIAAIDSQIEKLRTSIVENLVNIRRSSQSIANRLGGEYQSLQGSLRSIPQKQREFAEIMRQQGIKEKLYLFLLEKREESAITRASAVANSTPLDEAYSAGGPISPDTKGIYRLALILGLVIPAGFIYIKDLLNDKVSVRTDITKVTETPIIGEVAHHRSMTRQFVVGVKDRSILSEQFRILRTNLQFLLAKAPTKNPVVLVTSTISGEGKTFCSMNMAAAWAIAGKKTVIIELDLRKPKISKALNLPIEIGISNFVIGNTKKDSLPQKLPNIPNLYVIGAGPIPPNPSELIMDSKMDELFTYLRANFDIIIIDSAPVGLVSDSKILSRFVDATLYVVRQRYTVKKQLGYIDDLYKNKALPNMGIIVNDVKMGGNNSYYGYGYGYGYGFGYNYHYSYGYGEQEKKGIIRKVKDLVGL
jgi:tyrosine-protein kinase Etk/Wzc